MRTVSHYLPSTCSISVPFEIAEKAQREEHVLEASLSLNVATFPGARMYHVHSSSNAGSNGGHFPERDRVNVYSRGTDWPIDGRTVRWMDRGTDKRTDIRPCARDSPANRILMRSSGCSIKVETTPPEMPATKYSYLKLLRRLRREAPGVALFLIVVMLHDTLPLLYCPFVTDL